MIAWPVAGCNPLLAAARGVLAIGKRFRVVSVKDCFGPPLVSDIYDVKTVRIPMNAVTPLPPDPPTGHMKYPGSA